MTDSINRDISYSVLFNFFVESPRTEPQPNTETAQVNMSGRSWEVNVAELRPTKQKQVVFTAKSGSLFR